MDPLSAQVYDRLLATMALANRAERRAGVKRAAEMLSVTERTVYRQLGIMGWESGRKTRADAGRSTLTDEEQEKLAGLVATARNKRGQPNLPLKEAIPIAVEQGMLSEAASALSYGGVARSMRRSGRGMIQMRAKDPGIARVSDHPNHVWAFDISNAIQWYFLDPVNGKRLDLYMDGDARFYEGKRQNFLIPRVIHRFIMVDHYSGAYFVWYYYSAGESAEDIVDFFFRAMSSKELGAANPFRGLPEILLMDLGPGNRSGLVLNLLEELDIEPQFHEKGNAKANGCVESRHNHWQRTFEGRLALRPAGDLDELNRWQSKFCAVANGQREHSRHGRPPLEMWNRITAEQLRECPEREMFLSLATRSPVTCTLNQRLQIRIKGEIWELTGPNLFVGQKVSARISPFIPGGIRVWDVERREISALKIVLNEAGFQENGRRHAWGDPEAKGATAPLTPAAKIIRAVEKDRVRVDGVFDNLDDLLERQAYLSRRGSEWEPRPASVVASSPMVGALEALEEVVRRLGRPLGSDREAAAWWQGRIGDGISMADLDVAWSEFCTGATATGTLGGK